MPWSLYSCWLKSVSSEYTTSVPVLLQQEQSEPCMNLNSLTLHNSMLSICLSNTPLFISIPLFVMRYLVPTSQCHVARKLPSLTFGLPWCSTIVCSGSSKLFARRTSLMLVLVKVIEFFVVVKRTKKSRKNHHAKKSNTPWSSEESFAVDKTMQKIFNQQYVSKLTCGV